MITENLENDQHGTKEEQSAQHVLLEKKKNFTNYISHLDGHINKALLFQNKAVCRKKLNLMKSLDEVKEKIYVQTQKTRKMEEFFKKNCLNILTGDITKWDDNKAFFQDLFQFYDQKIKDLKAKNYEKKKQVEVKTKQLKNILKNQRQKQITRIRSVTETSNNQTMRNTILNFTSKTLKSLASTRIQTQNSLPSLSKHKINKLKTLQIDPQSVKKVENSTKHYMLPLKSEKSQIVSPSGENLKDFLNWYKKEKKDDYSWFEKLFFVDRNFKKIVNDLN